MLAAKLAPAFVGKAITSNLYGSRIVYHDFVDAELHAYCFGSEVVARI